MVNWKRPARRAALATCAAVGAATGGYALASAATGGAPPGPGGGGGWGGGPGGTVTAVSDGSFVVQAADGTSQTVDTNSSTTYGESGDPNPVSTVAIGERVQVRYARPTNPGATTTTTGGASTTPVASHVEIVLTQLAGTVVSKATGSFVLSDGQGFYRTIKVDGTTQYFDGSTAKTLDDVTVGRSVAAYGAVDADHTDLDAAFVDLKPDVVTGTVQSVDTSAGTITVTTSSGTVTVDVGPSTTYQSPGSTGSLGAVTAGDRIQAQGVRSGDTLAATAVEYSSTQSGGPQGQSRHPGGFGPGGFGPRGRFGGGAGPAAGGSGQGGAGGGVTDGVGTPPRGPAGGGGGQTVSL